jgi:4'-phosphopantetheinyl transferase EntD
MQDDIAATLRDMLGLAVGIGVTDPRDALDDLWSQEQTAVARAIAKRRHEFAAGRRAARQAMEALGTPPEAILVGTQRAPIWPAGLAGSIAHCDTICIAAVSETLHSIGIDIEPATALTDDLIPIVCTQAELDEIPDTERGMTAKRIFCAKEAFYKAQFPHTGQVIGFDALRVSLNQDDTFDVILKQPLPNLPTLHGQIRIQHNMILASVAG